VGGTTLALNSTGTAWASEIVWNWAVEMDEPGVGSSGGISSYYSIPSWQTNVSNLAGRGGSTSYRNIPDVAACADYVYEIWDKDKYPEYYDGNAGTSCAAPLWAGFMALVNQQLAANGEHVAGFINPALYTLAAGTNYASCFHDVTSGNNTWSSSPSLFYAQTGYDLCTGLGTMNGNNLINALAPAVPAPAFQPPVASAGKITLKWNSVSGHAYQVQYISNVTKTNWANLGSAITASNSVATASDTLTNSPRFYRVILLP
jgi:subtilase family serine protease